MTNHTTRLLVKIIAAALLAVAIWIALYLLAYFVFQEADVANWSNFCRGVFISLWLFVNVPGQVYIWMALHEE